MNGTEETYTTSDGYVCHYRSYPAVGEPCGTVVCLHGIQSHAGWYEGSCAALQSTRAARRGAPVAR